MCNDTPFQEYLGQVLTDGLREFFEDNNVEIVEHGYGVTCDLIMTRIRVYTDSNNIIVRINTG